MSSRISDKAVIYRAGTAMDKDCVYLFTISKVQGWKEITEMPWIGLTLA